MARLIHFLRIINREIDQLAFDKWCEKVYSLMSMWWIDSAASIAVHKAKMLISDFQWRLRLRLWWWFLSFYWSLVYQGKRDSSCFDLIASCQSSPSSTLSFIRQQPRPIMSWIADISNLLSYCHRQNKIGSRELLMASQSDSEYQVGSRTQKPWTGRNSTKRPSFWNPASPIPLPSKIVVLYSHASAYSCMKPANPGRKEISVIWHVSDVNEWDKESQSRRSSNARKCLSSYQMV